MTSMTRYPFEVPYTEVETDFGVFIDAVFDALQSSFLLLPRGPGFALCQDFQQAYEVLKRHTAGFAAFESQEAMEALKEDGLAFVVLRTMSGFSPPELAHIAAKDSEIPSRRTSPGRGIARCGPIVRYFNPFRPRVRSVWLFWLPLLASCFVTGWAKLLRT